jgi:hypothetical protein
MSVNIDKAGSGHQPGGVDNAMRLPTRLGRYGNDATLTNGNVRRAARRTAAIDNVGATD